MKRLISYIIAFSMLWAFIGCADELMPDDSGSDGESRVSVTLDFKPMSEGLVRTKSAGDALTDISSLYVLLYDADTGNLKFSWEIGDYELSDVNRTDGEAENGHSAEVRTRRATFKLPKTVAYGRYFMYAVANIDNLLSDYEDNISTVGGLKNLPLKWNGTDVSKNGQMMGRFTVNGVSSADESIILNKDNVNLHAWLRRAASKITVSYDGTNLEENVSVYILAVSIKDIPKSCPLGTANKPENIDTLIHDGGIIKYFEGDVQPGLENFVTDYKAVVSNKKTTFGSDHSETAEALFFYENMQGAGDNMPDKRQDADKDGVLDNPGKPGDETYRLKDAVPCGTYIEVDAIYRSENQARPGIGIIKYRFMLGQDVIKNYNAVRNCHYKLTLKFNNFANDVDWHIEYKEQVLEVTEPGVMNYQGKIFVPEYRPGTANYNLGHNFVDNEVKVTSYIENDDGTMVNWKMEFDEGDGYKEESSWFEPVITDGYLPYIKHVTFRPKSLNKEEIDIDLRLQNATQKGTKDAPYNLANPGQVIAPEDATIKCTANCYIVDAPGYYILPLVYGNAFHNFQKNENAYKYSGSYSGDQILSVFKDYMGREITTPYIQDLTRADYTPKSAFLVWQDENNLVSYTVWNPTADIEYLPEAYGGKGGIMFRVERETIKQGNAVIGLSTGNVTSGNITIPPVMWSWHIWVTDFSYLKEADRNIEVTTHGTSKNLFMPVNLGWCSGHGDKIKYYKARKCKVKFTAGLKEKVIELEQKSHIAFTRGNNTYYQWGRKDPFVGATGNVSNKLRYYSVDWADDANPPMLSADNVADNARYTTRGAIDAGVLIQNPRSWHNPRRKKDADYPYVSDNEIYRNLWQGRIEITPGSPSLKTIYDPCPVGYQVSYYDAFSGFTTTGDNTNMPFEWYDVQVRHIADYDEETGECGVNGIYSKGLYEFYTNTDKLQSIIFPETGYRDWNDYSNAYKLDNGPIGYIWTAGNVNGDDNNSYNFEFSRKDESGLSYIRPKNMFYPCDGFPIRPCVYDTHKTTTP